VSKRTLKPFLLFNAVDLSVNQLSVLTTVNWLDNVGIIVTWSGTTPVGVFTVECSNDGVVWSTLNFGSVIQISGNTGDANINMNQLPFDNIRVRYTATSGTGTLSASLSIKQVGG